MQCQQPLIARRDTYQNSVFLRMLAQRINSYIISNPDKLTIMLLLTNAEGDRYNPFIDNYLVVKITDYTNTRLTEIEQLLKTVESSHEELVMVEAEEHGWDLIQFLENIDRLCIFKADKRGNTHYLTVQKSLLTKN